MQTVCFIAGELGRKCCDISSWKEKGVPILENCKFQEETSFFTNPVFLYSTIAVGTVIAFSLLQRYLLQNALSSISQKRSSRSNENVGNLFERNTSYCDKNALVLACKEGNRKVIEQCLQAGVDINAYNDLGKTSLTEACKHKKWEVVKFLIQNGADINQANKERKTILHFAATLANADMITFLIDNKADCNIQDNMGQLPLHHACREANVTKEIIQILFRNTDQKKQIDEKGNTFLHLACRGNKNAVIFLLSQEKPFELNQKNDMGQTPLHLAAETNRSDIINLLEKAEADPNIQDNDGETALHYAAHDNYVNAMKSLLGFHNIQTNIVNAKKESPFHTAIFESDLELVEQMVQSKKFNMNQSIEQEELYGMTPMHLATHLNKLNILKMLIENGADINQVDNQKRSPLLFALKTNKIQETKLLLKYTDDKTLQSIMPDSGITFVEYVATHFDEKLLRLLALRKITFTCPEERKDILILHTLKNFHKLMQENVKLFVVKIEELDNFLDDLKKINEKQPIPDRLKDYASEIYGRLKYFEKFSQEVANNKKSSVGKWAPYFINAFQIIQSEHIKPIYDELSPRLSKVPSFLFPVPPYLFRELQQGISFPMIDDLISLWSKIAYANVMEIIRHLRIHPNDEVFEREPELRENASLENLPRLTSRNNEEVSSDDEDLLSRSSRYRQNL